MLKMLKGWALLETFDLRPSKCPVSIYVLNMKASIMKSTLKQQHPIRDMTREAILPCFLLAASPPQQKSSRRARGIITSRITSIRTKFTRHSYFDVSSSNVCYISCQNSIIMSTQNPNVPEKM